MKKICAIMALLVATSLAHAGEAVLHKVAGRNIDTTEMVLGYVSTNATNGRLYGSMHDRLEIYDVDGVWIDKKKHKAVLKTNSSHVYVVEVVE